MQETFDEMKSKAEEEASRQRSGGLMVWLEFFIYIHTSVRNVSKMSHFLLSNSSYLITCLFLQLGDLFHSSEKHKILIKRKHRKRYCHCIIIRISNDDHNHDDHDLEGWQTGMQSAAPATLRRMPVPG